MIQLFPYSVINLMDHKATEQFSGKKDVVYRMLTVKGNQRQFITRYFKMCKERLGKYWIAEIKKLYELDENTKKSDEINFENHIYENL